MQQFQKRENTSTNYFDFNNQIIKIQHGLLPSIYLCIIIHINIDINMNININFKGPFMYLILSLLQNISKATFTAFPCQDSKIFFIECDWQKVH